MAGTEPTTDPTAHLEEFAPSVQDVLAVKQLLSEKGKQSRLPIELIDIIIDFAEYWVCTATSRSDRVQIRSGVGQVEDKLLLRSWPIGFVPTEDSRIDTEEDGCQYPTAAPTPGILSKIWTDSMESSPNLPPPHDATQEAIDSWTKDSPPRGEFACRKVVFTIKSHDQGRNIIRPTSHYEGSTTWFDVGLERLAAFRDPRSSGYHSLDTSIPHFWIKDPETSMKKLPSPIICCTDTIIPETRSTGESEDSLAPEYTFHHELNPPADILQRNLAYVGETKEHKITWSCTDNIDPESIEGKQLADAGRGRASGTGEFVRNLKVGDVVTLWGKSRFVGWQNNVEEVRIDVYWAV